MSTTAEVAETRWKTGGLTPSGGAGPVLACVHGLPVRPAELTAHTCQLKPRVSRHVTWAKPQRQNM